MSHQRGALQEFLDGPAIVPGIVAQVPAGAFDELSPPQGCEELPFALGEGRDFVVAVDHVVVLAAPGEGEIGDAVVPVGELEVQDAGEVVALEVQVPRGEVAVDELAWPIVRLQVRDLAAGGFQVLAEVADFFRAGGFVGREDFVQGSVRDDDFATAPAGALAQVREFGQGQVKFGQQTTASALFDGIPVAVCWFTG